MRYAKAQERPHQEGGKITSSSTILRKIFWVFSLKINVENERNVLMTLLSDGEGELM